MEVVGKSGCKLSVVNFNNLMNGYYKNRNINIVVTIFPEMSRKGIHPNAVTCSTLINGLCKANLLQYAHKLFREMQLHGIPPDAITYSSLLPWLYKNACTDEEWRCGRRCRDMKLLPIL